MVKTTYIHKTELDNTDLINSELSTQTHEKQTSCNQTTSLLYIIRRLVCCRTYVSWWMPTSPTGSREWRRWHAPLAWSSSSLFLLPSQIYSHRYPQVYSYCLPRYILTGIHESILTAFPDIFSQVTSSPFLLPFQIYSHR